VAAYMANKVVFIKRTDCWGDVEIKKFPSG